MSAVVPEEVGHWFTNLYPEGVELTARPSLTGAREADVCIVGGGFTGLWTAYALRKADPSLDVVVLEARVAGYGASGRNGGAVVGMFQGSREHWTKRAGRDAAIAMERAVQDAIDRIGKTVDEEGIDCSFSKNGVLMVARSELELARLREQVEDDRAWGFGPEDCEIIGPDDVTSRIKVAGPLGARFSRHCASVDPGALVRGLADAVERAGVTIYEGTRVTRIEPGQAVTQLGTVRAKTVVRATEAYTESIENRRRLLVPVRTSMLVTERLDERTWESIGWGNREALLAEHPFLHLQHTADHRITIGGDDNRVPYVSGSRPSAGSTSARVEKMYRKELVKLFPSLADVRIERTWQGVFGATRNWTPSVGVDRNTGLAWAGGYVGEGVAASNLAGRTLADLILQRETDLTRLPFVGEPLGRWEPEPLRTIGANAIWSLRTVGERLESRTGRANPIMDLANRIAGWRGRLG
ncbi:MAG TPA: FAD-dependent oxidoreductase [Baekduia sp.]|nr:FAD-dependent oxidoreductase [Baekduia sp.]